MTCTPPPIERLNKLYPHLNRFDIDRKIYGAMQRGREADSPSKREVRGAFYFLRAFVPYFYDILRRDKILQPLEEAAFFKGWCVGDPHPENFGAILTGFKRNGDPKHIFTMNDPDDGGPGQPVVDLLRYLVSLSLSDLEVKHSKVIESYLDGLKNPKTPPDAGGRPKYADLQKWVINKVGAGGKKAKSKYFEKEDDKKKWRLTKDNEAGNDYGFVILDSERKAIKKAVKKAFSDKYRVCCIEKFKKTGGGSGGLFQYRLLMLPKSRKCDKTGPGAKKKVVILDLKTLVRSGMHPLYCLDDDLNTISSATHDLCGIDQRDRVKRALKYERGYARFKTCRTKNIPDIGPVLMRPRWKGDAGMGLELMQKKSKLMRLQAFVLGQIHGKRLNGSVKAYAAAVKKDSKALKAAAAGLRDQIVADYGDAKQALEG